MDKDYIYSPCISKYENSFFICMNNYKYVSNSKCVDYALPFNFNFNFKTINGKKLKLQLYENMKGKKIFIIFMVNIKPWSVHAFF